MCGGDESVLDTCGRGVGSGGRRGWDAKSRSTVVGLLDLELSRGREGERGGVTDDAEVRDGRE